MSLSSGFACGPPVPYHNRNSTPCSKMKNPINRFQILLVPTIAFAAFTFSARAATLSDQDKQFLAGYEKIHAALAADDLAATKTAAKDLGGEGADIANSASLKDARVSFEKLNARAKTLVAGQSGYYLVHCPMLKKDWVQTSTAIANPYAGKEMATCGEIRK